MTDFAPSLAQEARYLHDSLFPKAEPLADGIVHRYEDAHRTCFPDEHPTAVARIVARRLDVAAVEFALRRRHSCPELTRKMNTLCYLIEIQSPYQNDFIAARPEPVRAIVLLLRSILGTGWKLLKGECLVRIHGLL